MTTNANSELLASALKDAKLGTFTSLITRKQGALSGKGPNRKLYGDDQVQVTILTGFKYENLVAKSLELLYEKTDAELAKLAKEKGLLDGKGNEITKADVRAARNELDTSFNRTLSPIEDSDSSTRHVYEPLVIGGDSVRGGRVYRCIKGGERQCHCRECLEAEGAEEKEVKKAPLNGTIYIQGLKIWQKVLEVAPNGPKPKPKSAAKTVAKDLIRSLLPISKYVSYRLEPGTDFLLRAGGSAQVQATEQGFLVSDAIVGTIKRAS